MHSFQGSLPLRFISFCLDNRTNEEKPTPCPSLIGQPEGAARHATEVTSCSQDLECPFSFESNVDVNAYAEEKARLIQTAQLHSQQDLQDQGSRCPDESVSSKGESLGNSLVPFVLSSTHQCLSLLSELLVLPELYSRSCFL